MTYKLVMTALMVALIVLVSLTRKLSLKGVFGHDIVIVQRGLISMLYRLLVLQTITLLLSVWLD